MPDDEHTGLPPGHSLDVVSRPGWVVLRRRDGSFVAAFGSLEDRREDRTM